MYFAMPHLIQQFLSFGIDLRELSECFIPNKTNFVTILIVKLLTMTGIMHGFLVVTTHGVS
jgi:hypothetical protein